MTFSNEFQCVVQPFHPLGKPQGPTSHHSICDHLG